MTITRRGFFATLLALFSSKSLMAEEDGEKAVAAREHAACLVDTTLCIGCRKCEEACNNANGLLKPEIPFEDKSVFTKHRRPSANAFTVVNAYPGPPSLNQRDKDKTTVKTQCMHCLDPACVSACIVGALVKTDTGPVIYNPEICLGCRYCMVACPFEIPAYEYSDPLKPRVRKCEFCTNTNESKQANPACAAACPTEAIVFGKREDLLNLAKNRISQKPDQYLNYIYGEYEVGGTSWMYLVGRKPEEIGLIKLPKEAPPRVTENIQHGIFKYGIIPLAFYGFLASIMAYTSRREKKEEKK